MDTKNVFPKEINVKQIVHKVSTNCTAYKAFLREHAVVSSTTRFDQLPITNKENYIKKYSLKDRIYKGNKLSNYYLTCTSSGSTDEPTIWVRDAEYDKRLEGSQSDFLHEHFLFKKRKNLIVIGFGLGTTQAGMMHLKSSWEAAYKYKNTTVVTPNADPEMAAFIMQKLYQEYDQVICIGYPPLLSDFVNTALAKKFPVHRWNLKLVYAGENPTIYWRNEIIKKIHGSYRDIISFYGCTEAGMVGFENKMLNKLIYNFSLKKEIRLALFGEDIIPTLVDVSQSNKYLEILDNNLVITADQPMPLVRYDLLDTATYISHSQIYDVCKKFSMPIPKMNDNVKYLAIYGRNTKRIVTPEIIKETMYALGFIKNFEEEFQYEETIIANKKIKIDLTLYGKVSVSFVEDDIILMQKKFEKYLLKRLKQSDILGICIIIHMKNADTKKGYKLGKLRYILH